jgi:hypothetical protein
MGLERKETPGQATSPQILAFILLLSHLNASLTYVINNHTDQKNATSDLGDLCGLGEYHLLEGIGIMEPR